MKALVTGASGFIGSNLVDLLLERGDEVIGIDKVSYPYAAFGSFSFTRGHIPSETSHVEADIVYHLAGPVGPVGVLDQASRITPEIVDMAEWLRHYVEGGIRVVFVSTSEIYGSQQQPMGEERPRIIEAGYSARMEYAVAKLAAETMLLNMGGDVRIIRPFNVAGKRQKTHGGFVLPRFIEQAKRGDPLTVYQPGTQRRAFTNVRDICEGIVLAGEKGQSNVAYNLGNPDNACTIIELATDVIRVTGSKSDIDIVDPQELWGPSFREAPDKVPFITTAKRELGWIPQFTRRETIEDAL